MLTVKKLSIFFYTPPIIKQKWRSDLLPIIKYIVIKRTLEIIGANHQYGYYWTCDADMNNLK